MLTTVENKAVDAVAKSPAGIHSRHFVQADIADESSGLIVQ
jgi:hypothetical protein